MTTAIESVSDKIWDLCEDSAVTAKYAIKAFLAHLEETGWKIVPVEEKSEMLHAAIVAEDHGGDGDTWSAKLSAAPKYDPEVM